MNAKNTSKTQKTNSFYLFGVKAGRYFFLCFSAILFLTSFLSTAYIDNIMTQKVLYKWDLPFIGILVILLFICVVIFIINRSSKVDDRICKVFLPVTLSWIFLAGLLLIIFGRTTPAADAMTVYSMAESAANGDLGFIDGGSSYLSYYPQQIGMVTLLILPIKLWNLLGINAPAYHVLKLLNTCFAVVIVLFGYLLLNTLLKDNPRKPAICAVFLLLSGMNLPFLLYTSFLYGEIPSAAAVSVAVYALALLLSEKSSVKKQLLLSALVIVFTALAVFLRKNTLVFVIALEIVLLFEFVKSRKPALIILFLLVPLCSSSIQPAVLKAYEAATGKDVFSGVTALSYIAMGMQEAERGAGWYNGFNFDTYTESGFSSALSNELSRSAIDERLSYFRRNPSYAFRFYLEKYLSQWSDGTYASRQATWAELGGRSPFVQSIYTGFLAKPFIMICDIFQSIIYLGTACFFAFSRFSAGKASNPQTANSIKGSRTSGEDTFFLLLGIIYVFGGFLFHMLWEANSRYIFPYSLFLLPYAAAGLVLLSDRIRTILSTALHKDI